jgi:hypothetical protein
MPSISDIDKYVNDLFNNKILYTIAVLFVTLYGGLAAPKLPKMLLNYFDNEYFKLFIIFIIAYIASKDYALAIISTISLFITFNTLTIYKINDKLINVIPSDQIVTSDPKVDVKTESLNVQTGTIKSMPPVIPKTENFTYMNENVESFSLESPSPYDMVKSNLALY